MCKPLSSRLGVNYFEMEWIALQLLSKSLHYITGVFDNVMDCITSQSNSVHDNNSKEFRTLFI